MTLSWDSLCRLCVNSQGADNVLFNIEGESKAIFQLIEKYLSIYINPDDSFPSSVCRECTDKLIGFNHFASQCEKSQAFLVQIKNISLQDDIHLQCLKSEFELGENEIKIEKNDASTIISNIKTDDCTWDVDAPNNEDDDLDYIPLSNLRIKKKIYVEKSKVGKKKRGRPRNRKFSEDFENDKMLSDLEKLMDGEMMDSPEPLGKRKEIKKEISHSDNDNDDNLCFDDFDTEIEKTWEKRKRKCKSSKSLKKRKEIKEEISDSDNDNNDNLCFEDFETETDKTWEKPKKKYKTSKSPKIPDVDKKLYAKRTNYSMFKFECHFCEKEFLNWNALKLHVKKVHQGKPKVLCLCFKYLTTRRSLQLHMAQHDPSKSFNCESCDKVFGCKASLDTHALYHLPKNEFPFVCCKCAKRFTTARILKSHELTHVPREERFVIPCDLCDSKFATKGALLTHTRVIHEKLKPFVCDTCGHAFAQKSNLDEHVMRHGDAKNFVCHECNKRFKTKGSMVRHQDTHKGTAYQCPQCPVILNSRRTLRNHMYVHETKARHACPFCEKAFKRRKDVKCHIKLHTGERSYTCPWCTRTFTNGSNCRIHKRRMHPTEFQIAEAFNPFAPSHEPKTEPRNVIHTILRTQPLPSPPVTEDFNLIESTEHRPFKKEVQVDGSSVVEEMKSTSYPIICK